MSTTSAQGQCRAVQKGSNSRRTPSQAVRDTICCSPWVQETAQQWWEQGGFISHTKRVLQFSDLSSKPSYKGTQLLFHSMVFHCFCEDNTEWFRGKFCGLFEMQILGKCGSCGSSPWHCQICSAPARTAGTRSQTATDHCCSYMNSLRALTDSGAGNLLGFSCCSGRQKWAGSTDGMQRECKTWVQLELHQHLSHHWVQTLHSSCCGFWQGNCHDPGSPFNSPLLLIPPLTVFQQRIHYCISPFFSSGSSLLSFPPRCGGCFKVFFPFWQILAANGELTVSMRRIPQVLAVTCTADSSSCHPTEREAGFVCGMRIMLPSALRNQRNVTLLFSSQVHVLRDVPALKADNGRTF